MNSPFLSGIADRLDAATAELWRERRRVADEIQAHRAFEGRVRSIAAETPVAPTHGAPVTATPARARPGHLDRVRDAYESTVMDVPHYDEDYGDTYRESLREEFSPELAAALVEGTAFNERCKRMLLSAVSEAQSARGQLLEAVDTELDAVEGVSETLLSIGRELADLSSRAFAGQPLGTLDGYRARLDALEAECEAISERRQEDVFEQRRTGALPTNAPDVATYYYRRLDVDYPVMSAVADLLQRIDELRDALARAVPSSCHA